MELNEKLVRFDIYCRQCSHWNDDEHDDPCNECLGYSVNTNSEKPVMFEEKGAHKCSKPSEKQ